MHFTREVSIYVWHTKIYNVYKFAFRFVLCEN